MIMVVLSAFTLYRIIPAQLKVDGRVSFVLPNPTPPLPPTPKPQTLNPTPWSVNTWQLHHSILDQAPTVDGKGQAIEDPLTTFFIFNY